MFWETHGVRARIQLIQKSLIPGIHTILEYRIDQAHQSFLASCRFIDLQLFLQYAFKLLWWMMLDQCGSRASAWNLEAMASVLRFGIFICSGDKWDYQVLEGCEKLFSSSDHAKNEAVFAILFSTPRSYIFPHDDSSPHGDEITGRRNMRNVVPTNEHRTSTYVFDFVCAIERGLCLSHVAVTVCCGHSQ